MEPGNLRCGERAIRERSWPAHSSATAFYRWRYFMMAQERDRYRSRHALLLGSLGMALPL